MVSQNDGLPSEATRLEQLQRGSILTFHLLQSAIRGIFVRAPAEEFCAMAKSSPSEMIKLHLDN